MRVVYDEDGQFDLSDEGDFVKEMEEDIDVSLALKNLTKRQIEVSKLILKGVSYRVIAQRLGISEDSVKQFARRIKHHFLRSRSVYYK
jgi:DNA-binding NarL/FixJ family response regulator